MRAVVTRCKEASVAVNGITIGAFAAPETGGLLALVGVSRDDVDQTEKELDHTIATMARKLTELRILNGEKSVCNASAPILLISQFTLYGRTAKGRRPSWSDAAPGPEAKLVIDKLIAQIRAKGVTVHEGQFGAKMVVYSVNDGPFTVIVET